MDTTADAWTPDCSSTPRAAVGTGGFVEPAAGG